MSQDRKTPDPGAPEAARYAVAMAEELPLDYSVHIRVNRRVWEQFGTVVEGVPDEARARAAGQRWGRSRAIHEFMLQQIEESRDRLDS